MLELRPFNIRKHNKTAASKCCSTNFYSTIKVLCGFWNYIFSFRVFVCVCASTTMVMIIETNNKKKLNGKVWVWKSLSQKWLHPLQMFPSCFFRYSFLSQQRSKLKYVIRLFKISSLKFVRGFLFSVDERAILIIRINPSRQKVTNGNFQEKDLLFLVVSKHESVVHCRANGTKKN